MNITVTIENGNIFIGNLNLEELLNKVYQKGIVDGSKQGSKEEVLSFIQLSKELSETDRKLTVQTLIKKARKADVKIIEIDGKRLGLHRKDVSKFLNV